MVCTPEQFKHQELCCDLCPKGKYLDKDCNTSSATLCKPCTHGYYMDTKNYLHKCKPCRVCLHSSHLRSVSECQADQNRQCECLSGYYCEDPACEFCQPVSVCAIGKGVSRQYTPKSDTVCEDCPKGYFSNMTDFSSRCIKHTHCESLGQKTETPGTRTSDAKCIPVEHAGCHWMLPAGLWAGFVVTVFIVAGLLYWRNRRRSVKIEDLSDVVPVHLPYPVADLHYPTLCLDDRTCNHHCSCEDPANNGLCVSDLLSDMPPGSATIPAKCFAEPLVDNRTENHHLSSVCQSEPQEDEWSETPIV